MRNRTFMYTARADSLLGTMRFVSRHADTQVYGAIIPKAMTNQALLNFVAYKTYYAIASRAEPLKSRKSQKKSDSAISSKESPSKKKSTKDKKVAATKPKPTKKKAPVKADKGKGLNVVSEVALSEAAQLKEATKQSKKDFHISQASGSGTDEGTGTKPGVPNVPKYDSENEKESWGDSGEEYDDDEDDTKDDEGNDATDVNKDSDGNDDDDGNDGNDGDGDDDDANDDDKQEDDDTNDDDKETDTTTSFPSLPDFSSVFKFNDKVTNLEKDLSEIKQVDQYAQALSFIPAISTYEAAASLSEFELTKILIEKIEKNKSYDKADYKRELYNALVKYYQNEKDLFDTYGEVFTLKRSLDGRDKDQDPSARSDRETKRRESSKEADSSRDSRSKEKKSSSTSKHASHSQHKPSGKSAHAEELSHKVNDSGVQQDQKFDMGNNVEQPAYKETWISQVVRAKEPRTSFDELMDTSFDFSAFVLNWLNIKDLTQEILVGPAFELLKGTCKSLTELEYHLEECSKSTTERLDQHNPEGKPYPFDLSKPLPLILYHRGHQVIPQDFFINNDQEYLKGGDLSRRYSTSVRRQRLLLMRSNGLKTWFVTCGVP
ncbi:hypothetical protein Tco_0986477 [Tanacetum coccineum]